MHNQIADYLSTKSIEAVREKVCKAKNILIGLDILEMLLKQSGAGSDSFMMEFLLIGTEESPGETFLYQGRTFKSYRGIGYLVAMARGSADRYFQEDITLVNTLPGETILFNYNL